MSLAKNLRMIVPSFAIKLCLLFFLIPFFATAQQKTISGTVKDEAGEPISGVSVTVNKSTKGTSTDLLGKFKI
jgi:iron complex outermembrane receptor protein